MHTQNLLPSRACWFDPGQGHHQQSQALILLSFLAGFVPLYCSPARERIARFMSSEIPTDNEKHQSVLYSLHDLVVAVSTPITSNPSAPCLTTAPPDAPLVAE